MKTKADHLLVELAGPGVKPATVDPVLLLQLSEAFFRLLLKVAEDSNLGLSLQGLKVIAKCAAIQVKPSDPGSAVIASERTLRIVGGVERPPRGAEGAVNDVRKTIRALPSTMRASVRAGAKVLRLVAPAPSPGSAWESTELRVTVVTVGGAEPGARLRSATENASRPFHVSVTEKDARTLGQWLYREIDVQIDLCRDIDGNIEEAELREVLPISNDEPITVWRSWFSDNARAWDEVDNVQAALGRY